MFDELDGLFGALGDELPERCKTIAFWRELCAEIAAKGRTYRVRERNCDRRQNEGRFIHLTGGERKDAA